MKKLLKTFPETSLSENLSKQTSKVVENVVEEIQAIKEEISKDDQGLKILGELLGYLRQTKEMSTLMLCRKISKINMNLLIAELYSDDESIVELENNEKHFLVLKQFFESRGLGFKIKSKTTTETDVEVLNRLLGGKLVIK